MANEEAYRKLLDSEAATLRKLIGERKTLKNRLESINDEISRLREGVMGLAALAHVDLKVDYPDITTEAVKADIGLTDAIRTVLKESQLEFMSPSNVREALFVDEIYPIHQHKNPLASIHSVLKRLVDADQVVTATDQDTGKTVYAWADSYVAINTKLRESEVEDQ